MRVSINKQLTIFKIASAFYPGFARERIKTFFSLKQHVAGKLQVQQAWLNLTHPWSYVSSLKSQVTA
jgi:hypothetical protein